jgi:transposase
MSRYPTAGHWRRGPGLARASNESAGRIKSTRTRPGNPYRRIAARRGPQKANVAIQPSMLTAIWHIGYPGALYHDPGADYFTRLHPERAKTRALHQLEAMGYRVTLDRAN